MINIDKLQIDKMKSEEVKKYVSYILKEENGDLNYIELVNNLKNDSRKTIQKLGDIIYKNFENRKKEVQRVKNMYDFDKSFRVEGYIAGVDEVGRGPLAGPIVAASVILDLDYENNNDLILKINDSKKLSPDNRKELSYIIKEKAVSYSISELDNLEIDNKGITWCNNEVLKKAIMGLKVQPILVLSDGYRIKNCNIKNEFIIKGDAKSASIACASIIAKVYRDDLMKEYATMYPEYGFDKNAGYGTKTHIEAIRKFGYTPIHRKSFLKNILNIV
ncbi:Ribonuclease HII [Clostridium thermopalmarium DSM 5974]|uniref:Ribonuclease HII n=3 Tax=Clostridiaceae TaxID=31979 RepID=A0A151AQP1_9CLOT|nr:ribonuclease HII [Clostridium colicanis DSM 13634]PRR75283.1 Ribonuclease HII [Clostridium thermopalmarium DSM 5974]PVZ28039.1 RNase HII [Clostridium thermopalmarium DSM 5974]